LSSTTAVYGEPDDIPISEQSTNDFTNMYGMTKLAVGMAISSESIAHGLAANQLICLLELGVPAIHPPVLIASSKLAYKELGWKPELEL
jgi:hypothetical protein